MLADFNMAVQCGTSPGGCYAGQLLTQLTLLRCLSSCVLLLQAMFVDFGMAVQYGTSPGGFHAGQLLTQLTLLRCLSPCVLLLQAMFVDFGMAVQYGGVCYLRYDDTNPEAEKQVRHGTAAVNLLQTVATVWQCQRW
jgi:uncharacterized membrane protein